MPKGVLFDNIKYLSSKEAGSYAGYTHDYVSRLARNGRIPGQKVGRVWYVEAGPFLSFLVKHKHKKTENHESLSKELKKEYKSIIKREDVNGITPFTFSSIPSFPTIELPEKFLQRTFAFVFAVTLVFGTYLTKDTSYVYSTYNTSYVYVSEVHKDIQFMSDEVLNTLALLSGKTTAVASNAIKGEYNNKIQKIFTYENITQKISNTITVVDYLIKDELSAYLSIIKKTGEGIIVSADEVYTTSKNVRWSTIKDFIKESLFTTRLYVKNGIIEFVQEVGSTVRSVSINSRDTLAAVNISELVGDFINNTISKVTSFFVQNEDDYIFLTAFKDGETSLGHEVATTLSSPKDKLDIPPVSNDIASNTPQETGAKVVIERVIKSGVTESYVLERLEQLNNELKSKIYKLSSNNVTKIVNNYSTISKTNKIDKLKGVTINSSTLTDGTINGNTSFSGTVGSFSGALSASSFSISGDLTINTSGLVYDSSTDNVGIGTTSPYQKLSVAGNVIADTFIATSTTATSTFAGGLAVNTNGLVYDYSTGNVGIGTASPTQALDVGSGNIITTGTLGAGVATLASGSTLGNLTFANGSITDSSGTISFGNENLSTTGTLSVSGQVTFSNTVSGILAVNSSGILSATTSVAASNIEDKFLRNDANDTTSGQLTAANFVASSASATSTISAGLTLSQTPGDYRAGPTLAFGDGDTGFYEKTDDLIRISIAGVPKYEIGSTGFYSNTTKGGSILVQTTSATVPGLGFSGDSNTGIGTAADDQLDRKSTRLNSSHTDISRMPSSA